MNSSTICCWGIFIILSRLDSMFLFKASCLWYWFTFPYQTHIYLVECINILRKEADLLLSAAWTASSCCISVAGSHICFCCSHKKKLFVCLNNYAPMFLISFLKSLESHYPVSGPSRFWIFRHSTPPSVESRCIHRATVGSPLTFPRSSTEGSMRPISNLLE